MNEKTEITGRTATTCTGRLNNGSKAQFTVGMRVEIISWRDAGDGGDVSYLAIGTIEAIGVGTEYGMVTGSTTAICRVCWDAYHSEPAHTSHIAARHLKPYIRS